MDPLLLAVLVGLGVGVVVGMLGAGGGILAVPAFIHLLGQGAHAASASSLVVIAATAVVGLIHPLRGGRVDLRAGIVFGALGVVGTVGGSRLSVLVPALVVEVGLAILLAVACVVMFRRAGRARRGVGTEVRRADWPLLVGLATGCGLLTGFFGVGGGFIVVPVLMGALGLPIRKASGTALVVLLISSLVGLASRIGTPVDIDWSVTLAFAVASMAGGALGGPIAARLRSWVLTEIFAVLLAVVAVVMVLANLG